MYVDDDSRSKFVLKFTSKGRRANEHFEYDEFTTREPTHISAISRPIELGPTPFDLDDPRPHFGGGFTRVNPPTSPKFLDRFSWD